MNYTVEYDAIRNLSIWTPMQYRQHNKMKINYASKDISVWMFRKKLSKGIIRLENRYDKESNMASETYRTILALSDYAHPSFEYWNRFERHL